MKGDLDRSEQFNYFWTHHERFEIFSVFFLEDLMLPAGEKRNKSALNYAVQDNKIEIADYLESLGAR